jgi:hypothetical protein
MFPFIIGDSGGPMIANNQVVGMTGFGRKDSVGNAPVTYTKLSNYRDWVLETMNNKESYMNNGGGVGDVVGNFPDGNGIDLFGDHGRGRFGGMFKRPRRFRHRMGRFFL